MLSGYPEIKKLGACSPYGESTPFVFNGRLMRLELADPTRGLDSCDKRIRALIRDAETGEILSEFGRDCYYFSGYEENDTFYVIGTVRKQPSFSGDTYKLFSSRDLLHWDERLLLSNPGWKYFNSALTKGSDGYVLAMEAGEPAEFCGVPFTCFFATSPDMVTWTFLDYNKGYPKDRYCGGPWLKYVNGYYYLICVTELPCQRYTNYICRTKDFDIWEVGLYNPFILPDNEDRKISPNASGLTDDFIENGIKKKFICSGSDIDMCEWNGSTYINYNVGDQRGFYYMCEAEYNGTIAELLEKFFI